MDTTSYLALSRQVALQRHLTTIATNLANTSTTAYRAEHTLFESVLQRPAARTRQPTSTFTN
jgi:flagellar basal-body rod protein FlgF